MLVIHLTIHLMKTNKTPNSRII